MKWCFVFVSVDADSVVHDPFIHIPFIMALPGGERPTVLALLQQLTAELGFDYTAFLPKINAVGVDTVAELAQWSAEELERRGNIPFGKAKNICAGAVKIGMLQPPAPQPPPPPPPQPPPQLQSHPSDDAMADFRKIMDRVLGMSG